MCRWGCPSGGRGYVCVELNFCCMWRCSLRAVLNFESIDSFWMCGGILFHILMYFCG